MSTLALSNIIEDTGEKKILVIEDDPEWQSLIGNVINHYDNKARVKYTFSVPAARQLMENTNYDLIIADHFLEGDDTGLDFWKECQSKHIQTPFMMLSGLTDREFLELIKKENDYPLYLSKRQVFEPQQLEEMLAWHLGDPIAITESLDQRFVLTVLLFAMVPFLGLPTFLSPPPYTQPTPLDEFYKMEQGMKKVRTADVEKAIKRVEKKQTKPVPMDVSKIMTPNTKTLMKDILGRAKEILVAAREQVRDLKNRM